MSEHHGEIDAPFRDAETPIELLGQLAGAASVCWSNPSGAGVFDSEQATRFVDAALSRLVELGWATYVTPPEVTEGDGPSW